MVRNPRHGRILQLVMLSLISITAGVVLAMIFHLLWADRTTKPLRPGDKSFFSYADGDTRRAPEVSASYAEGAKQTIEIWFQVRSDTEIPMRATFRLESSQRTPPREGGTLEALTSPTDADGRIALLIPPGVYRLVVIPDDDRFHDRDLETEFRMVDAGKELKVIAGLRQTYITGQVVCANTSEAIEGGRVVLDEGGLLERECITGRDGEFEFAHVPGGHHRLNVRLEDVIGKYLPPDEQSLLLPESQDEKIVRHVRFTLIGAASVSGQAKLSDGSPATGARVQALRLGRSWVTAVDDLGRFSIDGLAEGRFQLRVLHPWSHSVLSRSQVVDLVSGESRELTFEVSRPESSLSGIVVDSRGEGVPRANVSLPFLEPATPRSVLTDSGGCFEIKGVWEGDYPVHAFPPDGQDASEHPSPENANASMSRIGQGWVATELSRGVAHAGSDGDAMTLTLIDESGLVVIPRPRGDSLQLLAYSVEVTRDGRYVARKRFEGASGKPLRVGGLTEGPVEVSLLSLGEGDSILDSSSWSIEIQSGKVARLDEDMGLLRNRQ